MGITIIQDKYIYKVVIYPKIQMLEKSNNIKENRPINICKVKIS